MKPNVVDEKQCLPTPEELNRRFRYDAVSGLLYVKKSIQGSRKVGEICGSRNFDGYLDVRVNCKLCRVHRVIWAMVHGAWPDAQIDHINAVRDDNRLENLREATHAQNFWNKGISKTNSSGVKGVSWHARRQKWRAYITVERKTHSIGYFKTLEDAEVAIRSAREKHHGQFARHI